MDKSSSQTRSSADGAENDNKQDQYLRTNVIDVFGKETEPICDYLRCHHKFSEHGLRVSKCQCKHPRNSAAGAYSFQLLKEHMAKMEESQFKITDFLKVLKIPKSRDGRIGKNMTLQTPSDGCVYRR